MEEKKVQALDDDVPTVNFVISRRGAKDIVVAGDVVNQTLSLENKSEYTITNIFIKDTISEGGSFVKGTVAIEGTSYADTNPINGFALSDIKAGSSSTITYSVEISDNPPAKITNTSLVSFSANGYDYSKNSSTYTMELANGELSVDKTSDKSVVIKGSVLKYVVKIKNEGNIRNTNINFQDSIPQGTTFVEGSVKIDNQQMQDYNPETGFSLGNLDPQAQTVVSFDVKID